MNGLAFHLSEISMITAEAAFSVFNFLFENNLSFGSCENNTRRILF